MEEVNDDNLGGVLGQDGEGAWMRREPGETLLADVQVAVHGRLPGVPDLEVLPEHFAGPRQAPEARHDSHVGVP